MPTSSADRNPVEALAEEFLARFRQGEHPSLTEYTDRYPALADEIRDLFPALVMMEDIRPAAADATGPLASGPTVAEGQKLERLGDYRILREVGRGGMGIVYEAEQESLGRHVALKVLPAHTLLDPKRLQRFRREAKAAAQLHHTNIVPVYGVGEQDGLHYYVVQFIQGLGLDEVLSELRRLRRNQHLPRTEEVQAAVSKPGGRGNDISVVAQALLTGQFGRQPNQEGQLPAPPSADPAQTSLAGVAPSHSLGSDSGIHLPGQFGYSTLSESGRGYWHSVARIGIQCRITQPFVQSVPVVRNGNAGRPEPGFLVPSAPPPARRWRACRAAISARSG
jgi:hypothetical protein